MIISRTALCVCACVFLAASAWAQTTYRDPSGAYSVKVPPGWRAEKHPDGNEVTISKGDVSVSFDVEPSDDGSTPPPKSVLDGMEKQIMQQCPQAKLEGRGQANLAGAPAVYFQATCNDPDHGEAAMMVAAATTNGMILILNTTAPASQMANSQPMIGAIVDSIRLGNGGGARQGGEGSDSSPNSGSGSNAQKLRALEQACTSGVLTPDECAAKRAELTRSGNSSESPDKQSKLLALRKACQAGVFTPEECEAKRAAITGEGSNPRRDDDQSSPTSRPDQRNRPRQPDSANGDRGEGGGGVYRDPQGVFSVMVPQGWTAKMANGCYGPPENCPRGANGVNIRQRDSWMFVAMYSGNASQPSDVVRGVASEYQSEYRNFSMNQSDQTRINGLDVAYGTFSGVDQNGVTVALIVAGVASPDGRYFVVSSSVPQSEPQSVNEDLSAMLNSIRFGGR